MTGWRRRSGLAPLGVVLLGCGALGGCGDVGRAFGFARQSPDEFTVTTRAPLAMPPNDALPPPTPGAPRPQDRAARLQAEEALAPNVALQGANGASSAGQQALVADASGAAAAPVAHGGEIAGGSGLVGGLAFWRGRPADALVDAPAEQKRLADDATDGKPPSSGATPARAPN